MKKHDVKSGRTKPPEVRTREQVENETFNRMLLWLAVAAVVEVIMVLINRFYINARVSELEAKIALYYVLAAFPFVGAALFVILLALGIRRWKSGFSPRESSAWWFRISSGESSASASSF